MTGTDVLERRTGVDRRVRAISLRYPERRTGFDRRSPGTSLWSRIVETCRRRPAAIAWCIAGIMALSAADLLLTRLLVERGASEVNPIMESLFRDGFGAAAVVKGVVTVAVGSGIWLLRRYRRVLEFSLVVLVLLALLVAYEIVGLSILSG